MKQTQNKHNHEEFKDEQNMYASLISEQFMTDLQTTQIQDIPPDYVLRCIKGSYAGNFIYLNLTEEGERIGSDPNDESLTLTIENAGLAPFHASIHYEKDEKNIYKYILRDETDNDTWIKIRADTPIVIQQNMIFRTDINTYQITFSKKESNEVKQWLNRVELQSLQDKFIEQNINTLEDIKNLTQEKIDKIMDKKEKQKFLESLDDLIQDFPTGYINVGLVIENLDNPDLVYYIGWTDQYIDLEPSQKYHVDDPLEYEEQIVQQLCIKYRYGRYWFMYNQPGGNELSRDYVKLEKGQEYQLLPDDRICIGSLEFQVQRFNTGVYQDQGGRRTMEDALVCIQDIGISFNFHASFYAVFDGHGGQGCVQFCSKQLVENLRNYIVEDGDLDKSDKFYRYMYDSLQESIQQTDLDFFEKNNNSKKSLDSGCVACIVIIFGNVLICSNIGDCRGLISRNGQLIHISKDHKPYNLLERRRIQEAGGYVEFNRVNGKLGVSRAFGDFRFKKEENQAGTDIVQVEPDIRSMILNFAIDEFLVIACDGLFDVFSNQQCIDFVRNKLLENPLCEQDPQEIAKLLVQEGIAKSNNIKKSPDNISVVIVLFSRGISNLKVGKASCKSIDD